MPNSLSGSRALLRVVRGDEVRIYLPATEVLPLRKTWKKCAERAFPPPLISLLSTAHTAMRLRGSSGSSVHADPLKSDEKPVVATAETVKTLTFGDIEEAERERKLTWAEQMASGRPFLEVHREFRNRDVQNVSISYCFHCNEMCLWVYDQLVWPRRAGDPEPKL